MVGLMAKEKWTVNDVLSQQVALRGKKPFLQFEDGPEVTYAEMFDIVRRFAMGLNSLGVNKGDKVLNMLPNSPECVYVWLAVNALGAVEVPVNNAYKGYFLERVVNDSGSQLMIVDSKFVERIKACEKNLPHLKTLIVSGFPDKEYPEPPPLSNIRIYPISNLYDAMPIEQFASVTYRDLGVIMYTSGTTGPSKGVLMTHAHMYLYGYNFADQMRMTEDDVCYICLPIVHANAKFLQVYPALLSGGKIVIYRRFSASNWLNHIRKARATLTNTLGIMNEFIWRQAARVDDADNPLRAISSLPIPPEFALEFERRFGVKCIEGYGMTEIGCITYRPYDESLVLGSCGKSLSSWFEVKIVDPETDEELPPNVPGEIVVRPKEPWSIMIGYHNMPESTVNTWRNYWFHTGDAGKKDENGYFYFIDRIKDYIRIRAENISSFEIERVLMEHPAIEEAAAVGIKSEFAGGEDEIKVCLVLEEGHYLKPEDLVSYCIDRMPRFAVPRYVEFLEELPKTMSEKIQKHKLRETGVTEKTWDREKAGIKVPKD
jgi:crotonobetaine/carnitine-CoA ligase